MWSRLIACCAAFYTLVVPASAQPLSDRVRGDAISYVGWAGADSLGPQYDKSHLKAVFEASSMPQFLNDFLPRVVERVGRDEPQARQVTEASAVMGLLWRKPWAIAFSGMDLDRPGGPVPRTVFVCRAGPDADKLFQTLDQVIKNSPGARRGLAPVAAFRAGDLAGFMAGYDNAEAALAAAANQSLAGNASFKSAMARAGKEPAFAAYVDGEGFVAMLGQYMEHGSPRAAEAWPRVREAAGLDGFKRLVWTQGFEGPDWGTHVYVEAPAPRKGLMAMLDAKPVGDEMFKTIPATATVAGVSRFDAAALLDGIRGIAVAADPAAGERFDQALGQVNIMLGMDVRKDFLGAFGDEWAYYTDPLTGGRGGMGFVLVNRLRDPAKAQRALSRVVQAINQFVSQQPGNEVKIAVRQARTGDVTVNYVGVPVVSPAWAVQGGNFYFGMYPQVVASAARQGAAGRSSILDNKDFVALRQRLLAGGAKPSSVQFMDLQKTAPGGFQTWLMLSSFARFGDMFGIDSPAMLFPPLDVLMQHLAPAGSVTWADDAGFHMRGVGPFPLASLFAADTGGSLDPGSTAMMMSILLPSLNRAREQANRVKSASNLRQIGQAVQLHANENKGRFPDDIADLLKQEIPPEAFGNPRANGVTPPPDASPEQLAQWVRESSEYVYKGKGRNYTMGQSEVLAYEKPQGLNDGINILFGDGHVEFVPMAAAKEMIRTGRKPGRGNAGGL